MTTAIATPPQTTPFDRRLQRVFKQVAQTESRQPIPRRRLARMLGCSEERIQNIEEIFKVRLSDAIRQLECDSPNHINFDQ